MTDRDADRAIVEQVLSGDPRGFTELYARHAGRVRALLVRLAGAEAAEDLTQEVFLRACAHLPTFRGESGLHWWLCRIAANAGARHVRQARRRSQPLLQDRTARAPWDPEERVLDAEDRAAARGALARLDEDDRRLILLREISGLSYEEIRDRLEIPFLGTVRSRLHKAREALRRAWSRRA